MVSLCSHDDTDNDSNDCDSNSNHGQDPHSFAPSAAPGLFLLIRKVRRGNVLASVIARLFGESFRVTVTFDRSRRFHGGVWDRCSCETMLE